MRNEKLALIPNDEYRFLKTLSKVGPDEWKLIKADMEREFPSLLLSRHTWQYYRQHYTEKIQPNLRKGEYSPEVRANQHYNDRFWHFFNPSMSFILKRRKTLAFLIASCLRLFSTCQKLGLIFLAYFVASNKVLQKTLSELQSNWANILSFP